MDEHKMDGFRWKLGLTNMMAKDCEGRSGGLAVFWRRRVNVHVQRMSKLYIDADVTEEDGFVWRFTSFYGEPRTDQKSLSWKALRTLNAVRRHPRLCMGDFNEILLGCEKEGGPPRSQTCMDAFNEALDDCDMTDLGFSGDSFTWWNNNHDDERYVRERLDRAVADGEWRARFLAFKVTNGDPKHSDHRPMIVETNWGETYPSSRSDSPPFRFEAGWV
jgi:hypothetical protein